MQTFYTFLKFLLGPEVWIFIIISAGCLAAWARQWPRSARFTLFLLVVLYYGFTTRPLTQALVEPLESYYRPPVSMPVRHDAIVIFVGPPKLQPYTERPTIVGTRNTDLFLCGLVYVHAGSAPKVVLAMEASDEFANTAVEREVLQEWVVLLGYPKEAIIAVAQSVATHERARAIKQLLGSDNTILLLDSAMHLPRSAAAFKKVGFTVTPVPCDYEISTESWDVSDFVPRGANLKSSSAAVHEYLGLLTYKLRGLI
jgi:uncharacterized SAM-binding protein YcdF (DUF218 family)